MQEAPGGLGCQKGLGGDPVVEKEAQRILEVKEAPMTPILVYY